MATDNRCMTMWAFGENEWKACEWVFSEPESADAATHLMRHITHIGDERAPGNLLFKQLWHVTDQGLTAVSAPFAGFVQRHAQQGDQS